ncbi:MAG: hypothetical protein NTW30_00400 [Candidatus Aenigmarchaeota archaeon]|nr:hypothetical protein [Candidatus Aenigmarchaeota archaeon]
METRGWVPADEFLLQGATSKYDGIDGLAYQCLRLGSLKKGQIRIYFSLIRQQSKIESEYDIKIIPKAEHAIMRNNLIVLPENIREQYEKNRKRLEELEN